MPVFATSCTLVPLDCEATDMSCNPALLARLGLLLSGNITTSTTILRSDINHDGYSDRIVGANANNGAGAADKGAAYVFYGGASGPVSHPTSASAYSCTGAPDCTAVQNPENEGTGSFGQSASAVGDVNGDGFDDVIVGAHNNQGTGAADKGAAYIFYGSATGITPHQLSAVLYTCTGPPDCTVIQNPDNETTGNFGWSVSGAGDVNNDGFDDLIVGALLNQGAGAANKGAAYIFYGSSTGITSHALSSAAYSCTGPPDCTVIANPDDIAGQFGYSVKEAGDVNKDGFDDVIVGAWGNQGVGVAGKGAAYIYYGSSSGITTHSLAVLTYTCSGPPDCTVIQNPDNEVSGNFGLGVGGAGDVNGDGFDDVVVGARGNQGVGAAGKGAAYIYYGTASGITSHPLSAATYTCSGPPDCTVIQNPENESNGFYGHDVATAGDLNRDGFADVIINAYQNNGVGAADKGMAFVHYGSASGITSHPESASTYTCSGPPDCTAIQNPDNESTGIFGFSISGAGDVNKDGYGDVIIAARNNQGVGILNKGAAYFFYGGPAGLTSHPVSAAPYSCSGPPDCTVVQNPVNESGGAFGYSVGFIDIPLLRSRIEQLCTDALFHLDTALLRFAAVGFISSGGIR